MGGYGYCPSHSRGYWGSKLLLICTCDGTVSGFCLANRKLAGERGQARQMLERHRQDDKAPRYFPNWRRQRVEAIIWTLKNQLGLERHGGRVPTGLWACVVRRMLAFNAAIFFNWQISAPVKRSLTAYDH